MPATPAEEAAATGLLHTLQNLRYDGAAFCMSLEVIIKLNRHLDTSLVLLSANQRIAIAISV